QLTSVSDNRSGETTSYGYTAGRQLNHNGETGVDLHYDDPAHPGRVSRMVGTTLDALINYDGNGNVTSLPGRTLEFGPKNQLERVTRDDGTVITYVYDHAGRRVRKQV